MITQKIHWAKCESRWAWAKLEQGDCATCRAVCLMQIFTAFSTRLYRLPRTQGEVLAGQDAVLEIEPGVLLKAACWAYFVPTAALLVVSGFLYIISASDGLSAFGGVIALVVALVWGTTRPSVTLGAFRQRRAQGTSLR